MTNKNNELDLALYITVSIVGMTAFVVMLYITGLLIFVLLGVGSFMLLYLLVLKAVRKWKW